MQNILADLLEQLRQHRREDIASKTGLSMTTVNKIMSGENTNPSLHTLEKLGRFVEENSK